MESLLIELNNINKKHSPLLDLSSQVKDCFICKEKVWGLQFNIFIKLSKWNDSFYHIVYLEFIPSAHIVKISDEELTFITGICNTKEAIASLFIGDVKAVIYTKGSQGAELYMKNKQYELTGYHVVVQDTTGAGDAFIGGCLYKLLEKEVTQHNVEEVLHMHWQEILAFANASGALTTTGKGAMSSIPTKEEIDQLIQASLYKV